MEKEIWKDIVGYEGLYQVSNLGNVKRNVVLKNNIDRKGYYYVNLSKNGKIKCFRVHRLVAQAFIPNTYFKKEINHINCIKTDNFVQNLEWVSHQENMQHATNNHLISEEGIKKCILSMIKKTSKPVMQIKNGVVIATYCSCAEAKRTTGINHITLVANGIRPSAGGYQWKYKK